MDFIPSFGVAQRDLTPDSSRSSVFDASIGRHDGDGNVGEIDRCMGVELGHFASYADVAEEANNVALCIPSREVDEV